MRLGQSGSVEFGVDMDRVRDLSILSLVQSPIIIASTEILYVCVCLCVCVVCMSACVRVYVRAPASFCSAHCALHLVRVIYRTQNVKKNAYFDGEKNANTCTFSE